MNNARTSGILLSVSSLPSSYGIGDMGPEAFQFVDWLKSAGQTLWQVLPVGIADQYGCPYASLSAFGGDPLLISPEQLVQENLLTREASELFQIKRSSTIDHNLVRFTKYSLLRQVYLRAKQLAFKADEFQEFKIKTKNWSTDLALFMTLTQQHGTKWWLWSNGLSCYQSREVKEFQKQYSGEIEFHLFLQFLFDLQWKKLKDYANEQNVQLVGDIPIFVAHHSMDVWKNPAHFKLNSKFELDVEAGAAPDQFSEIGQKWGTPIYRWEEMEKEDYAWWVERMAHTFETFDLVRLDHFRGFCAVWEVPHQDVDARKGRWYQGPAAKLFDTFAKKLKTLPIIVEDLGQITPDVPALKERYQFPGMKILQFAFVSDNKNENLPEQIVTEDVVYTGTHDMETVVGRFVEPQSSTFEMKFLESYLKNHKIPVKSLHWTLIEMAFDSKAHMAIIPLQDVLGLGNAARMNVPGVQEGNWAWRLADSLLDLNLEKTLRNLSLRSQRNGL